MKKILVLLLVCFVIAGGIYFSMLVKGSGKAVCKKSDTSSDYCVYKGDIRYLYVNEEGLLIIGIHDYFDKESAKSFGFNITNGGAIAYETNIVDSSFFKEQLSAISLLALENKMAVEIHARGTVSGMMKADRIWLREK